MCIWVVLVESNVEVRDSQESEHNCSRTSEIYGPTLLKMLCPTWLDTVLCESVGEKARHVVSKALDL